MVNQAENRFLAVIVIGFVLLIGGCIFITNLTLNDNADKVRCEPELCWKVEVKHHIQLGENDLPAIEDETEMLVTAVSQDGSKVFGRVWVKTQHANGDEQARGEYKQLWLPVTDLTATPPKWLPVKQD